MSEGTERLIALARRKEAEARRVREEAERNARQLEELATAYRLVAQDLDGQPGGLPSPGALGKGGHIVQLQPKTLFPEGEPNSMIEAARRVVVHHLIGEFDVGALRERMKLQFPRVVETSKDPSVYSKLLNRLEKEDKLIVVVKRGRGRSPSIYRRATEAEREEATMPANRE